MARLNTDLLGISHLKWTGMGEFNSEDHYIYCCGQEYLRRNGVALMSMKESEMHYLGAISKMTEWSRFISKATIQNYSNPRLHPSHWCWRSWSWLIPWRSTRLSRTNTKKRDILFMLWESYTKVGNQVISRIIGKFGFSIQNEAVWNLTKLHQENMLVISNTLCQ